MKFIYKLPIASMMILLFVSGLSLVRSEESQKVVKTKGLFGGLVKDAISIKKIGTTSTDDYVAFGVNDDMVLYGNDDYNSAIALCAYMGDFCIRFDSGSRTGYISLTYTNYDTLHPSYSFLISESLQEQFMTNPTMTAESYINTKDLYICIGTYDSTTNSLIPEDGGCDLTDKSVDVGEPYLFITTSTSYALTDISYPFKYDDDLYNDDDLSGGAVAGIVIGVLVFLGCCIGGIAYLVMNKKKKTAQPQTTGIAMGPGQMTQNPTVMSTNAV